MCDKNPPKKIRSKSTSDVGNKENYIDRKTIVRKSTIGRNPFSILKENNATQTEVVNQIEQGPKKEPLRKSNLIKRLNHRSRRALCGNCLYYDEYIEDNLKILKVDEIKELIPLDLLRNCATYRILMVDWLVHLHEACGLLDTTLFTTVKNFDQIVTIYQLPESKYDLAAIISFWITAKACEHSVSLSVIKRICKDRCSFTEIIVAERSVLRRLKFKLIQVEPCTILYYYLKQQNLQNNKLVADYSLFCLHCALVLCEYSAIKMTLLAAQALYLTLLKLNIDTESFQNYVYENLIDDTAIFNQMVYELGAKIRDILAVKPACKHIVQKFSKTEGIVDKFMQA